MRALVLACTVVLATLVAPASASAVDTDVEVTRGEFARIHKGMRMDRAVKILDTYGFKREYDKGRPGRAFQLRTYLVPDGGRNVWVYYERVDGVWRVDVKFDHGAYDA